MAELAEIGVTGLAVMGRNLAGKPAIIHTEWSADRSETAISTDLGGAGR